MALTSLAGHMHNVLMKTWLHYPMFPNRIRLSPLLCLFMPQLTFAPNSLFFGEISKLATSIVYIAWFSHKWYQKSHFNHSAKSSIQACNRAITWNGYTHAHILSAACLTSYRSHDILYFAWDFISLLAWIDWLGTVLCPINMVMPTWDAHVMDVK